MVVIKYKYKYSMNKWDKFVYLKKTKIVSKEEKKQVKQSHTLIPYTILSKIFDKSRAKRKENGGKNILTEM